MKALLPLSIVCCLAVAGCDKEEADTAKNAEKADPKESKKSEDDAASEPEGKAEENTEPEKADAAPPKEGPCGVLDEDTVKKTAGVSADAEFESGVSRFVGTLCEYKWKEPDEAKAFTGNVGIAIPKNPFKTPEGAAEGYTKSLEETKKAMTIGGKPPTFEDVAGIGDQASWYESGKQLSVQSGTTLVHVSVSMPSGKDGDERALAEKLARVIVGQ